MPNPKIAPPTPPPFLVQVPRSVIRRLDAEDLLLDALTATGHGSKYGPAIAMHHIVSALAAAKRQHRRIARGRAIYARQLASKRNRGTIFDDVHFYLICWARIAKLGRFISRVTRFRRVGLVLRRYQQELKAMTEARDHLEHFEERLPGGSKRHVLKQPNDLFNISGDYMTFGGRHYNVGPNSVKLLGAIVADLRAAVLFDSLESLAASDQKRLNHHVRQAARDLSIARLMKGLERTVGTGTQPV